MSTETLKFTLDIDGNAHRVSMALGDNMKKLVKSIDDAQSGLSKFSRVAVGINQAFDLARNTVGKLQSAVEKVVSVGSESELQKMNLKTLFQGNTQAAEDMYRKISQYGNLTPYDKAGLLDAQKTMMSFGISGEKAFATLQQIGDIAMGDKQKMQSLTLAFSQMSSTGRLMGQDLLQMINAGFNPLNEISKMTGKSVAQLKEEMSKGAISADMVAQAFAHATSEGGLFYQAIYQASSTTAGKIASLQDTFNEVLSDIFNKIKPIVDSAIDYANSLLTQLIPTLQRMRTTISSVVDAVRNWAPVILGAVAAISILTVVCNANRIAITMQSIRIGILAAKLSIVTTATKIWSGAQAVLNAVMTANPIGLIIAAIAALIGIIVFLCTKITGWGSLWDGICGFMKYTFYAFVDGVKLYFSTLVNGIMIGLDKIKLGWYKFKEACGIGDSAENQAAIAQINADVERRQQAIIDGAKKVKENTEKAMQSLSGIQMGWKSSDDKETSPASAALGTNNALMAAVSGNSGNGMSGLGADSQTAQSTEAVATGGTRNTNVTINLKDLVGNINFNGSLTEKKEEMQRTLAEAMLRVLNMAQSSIS